MDQREILQEWRRFLLSDSHVLGLIRKVGIFRKADTMSSTRAALNEIEQVYSQRARTKPEGQRITMRGCKIAHAELKHRITALETEAQALRGRLAALPHWVPITAVLDEADMVRLAPEARHLTDSIKMAAYRAETALVRCLTPRDVKTENDGRAPVRDMLLTSADILPDDHRLVVRLHSLANPRSADALTHLCAMFNSLKARNSGTDLTLVYQAPRGCIDPHAHVRSPERT